MYWAPTVHSGIALALLCVLGIRAVEADVGLDTKPYVLDEDGAPQLLFRMVSQLAQTEISQPALEASIRRLYPGLSALLGQGSVGDGRGRSKPGAAPR